MQIPKSLESSWNQVSKDGTISKDDYKTLLRSSKTLSEDGTSVNKEVVDFLKGLNSQLETSTKEGGIPVASVVNFSANEGSSFVSQKSIADVPESLKTAWAKISTDNKITKDEYGSLLKFASAPENKALGQDEQDFLKNLQVLILSSKDVEVNIKADNHTKVEQEVKVATPVPVKETAKLTNDIVTPATTTKDSNTLEDPTIDNLNEIKALLAKIGDDSDLAPLKGIVDKRIDNSNKLKDFSSKVNDVYSSIQGSTDSKKLQSAKSVFQTEYNNLGDLKDLDSAKTLFQNATGYVDTQLSKLADKTVNMPSKKEKPTQVTQARQTEQPKKPVKTETKQNFSFVDASVKVPNALKSDWDKISADNKITAEELNDMLDNTRTTVNARPDKALLPNEEAFLRNLSKKVSDADGDLILKKEPTPVVTSKPKPTNSGSKIPNSLATDWAKISADSKITAEEFNSMLDNMKKIVSSRPDKALLPDEEAFLKDLNKKVSAAGGDLILKKEPTPVVTSKPKPTNSGSKIPDALKAVWGKISSDSKITADEFNSMLESMKKTVSSRPDKALLADEEAFLKALSKKINDAGGELKITNK